MAYKTCAIPILFLLAVSLAAAACTKEDHSAIVAFRDSFPPNTFPSSWTTEPNCCHWHFVSCQNKSAGTGRVNSLMITGEQESYFSVPILLNGSVPPSLGNLTALETLRLVSQPYLQGPIPKNWAKLTKLQYLIIYNTSISGPVPSFISGFADLVELEMNLCKLTGTIPASLGNLRNLWLIDLDSNKLTGTIPSTLFSKLKAGLLVSLELSSNKLTGEIPSSFANVDWRVLDLSYNMLCGPIPSGGKYPDTDGSGFAHNKCLCGKPLPPCK